MPGRPHALLVPARGIGNGLMATHAAQSTSREAQGWAPGDRDGCGHPGRAGDAWR